MSPEPIEPRLRRVSVLLTADMSGIVNAMAAARRIREHHRGARIAAIVSSTLAPFVRACPYFDGVEADGEWADPAGLSKLVARLKANKPDVIYDLQQDRRSQSLIAALKGSGILTNAIFPGATHQAATPHRLQHPVDRLVDQVLSAISASPVLGEEHLPRLDWVRSSLKDPPRLQPAYFGLEAPFVLIAPAEQTLPASERVKPEVWAQVCAQIAAGGVNPVLIGNGRDAGQLAQKLEPRTKNLVGRADSFQVAGLGERALAAIGEDRATMALLAPTAPAVIALIGANTQHETDAPRGNGVVSIRAEQMQAFAADELVRAVRALGVFGAA